MKSSINNQNHINNKNKASNNIQLENKENININKHLENDKSNYLINNLLGKHDTLVKSQNVILVFPLKNLKKYFLN